MTDYVVSTYFKHPSYWLVDGRPYFSVYELTKLLETFGSVDAARAALDRFRKKTEATGFPGLHLNVVVWGHPILPQEHTPANASRLVRQLGFDSVTSYVWIHHVNLPSFPATDYDFVRDKYFEYWGQAEKMFDVPYYPNVSIGLGIRVRGPTSRTPSSTAAIPLWLRFAVTRLSGSRTHWSWPSSVFSNVRPISESSRSIAGTSGPKAAT